MKFKTFRALVIAGGIALGVGAVALFVASEKDQVAEYRQNRGIGVRHEQQGKALDLTPEQARQLKRLLSSTPQQAQAGASSEADSAPAAQATGEGEPLRPRDGRILERVNANISGDKQKDAFRGEAWKVNIYKDAGNAQPNRLKIDYDRDEKWDEKWSFERENSHTEVKRFVAPADDETYAVEYRMRAGRWVRVTP